MWWTWEIGTGWKPGEITKPGENLVKFSKPGENLVNFQNLVKTRWIFKTWWKPGDFQNLLKTWWIFKTWWKPGDFQNLVKTWKTSWNPGEFSKLGKNLVNFQNLVKTWWIFKTWWKRGEFLKPGENLVNFQNLVKTWWFLCCEHEEVFYRFQIHQKKCFEPTFWWNLCVFMVKMDRKSHLTKTWWKPGDFFKNLV